MLKTVLLRISYTYVDYSGCQHFTTPLLKAVFSFDIIGVLCN